MAVRHSDGGTALEGGSLGWLNGEQVPTIFIDVLADLEAGDVSEPFRRGSSFHIVKVNELRSAIQRSEEKQVKVRHILIETNEVIDDQTAKQRLEEAAEKIRDGEDFGELAKLLSDDPGSANLGGDLGWTTAETFVPEFTAMINESEIGVLTDPFRTPFGWHILEVLGRRTYDNTEEVKEQTCVQRIRAAGARATREGRGKDRFADGEVVPACMESCPTGAIAFGDVNNPESRVRALSDSPRAMRLLEVLGVKPAISYLTKVRNDKA